MLKTVQMLFQLESLLLLLLICKSYGDTTEWYNRKFHHTPVSIGNDHLRYLSSLSNENLFNQTLFKIAIPRVMATRGHDSVRNFIVKSMNDLGWDVSSDEFFEGTIVGPYKFESIITTLDPDAQRHLVLACHYDSKMDREKALVLATDSAVPCSMMIHLAQLLNDHLQEHKTKKSDLTFQFIFFDGEEAFLDWTATDSIYGARHLAHKLWSTAYPDSNSTHTHLHRMDVMVLLDLLGYRQPTFQNFFKETSNLYLKMQEIENNLNGLKLINTNAGPYFGNLPSWGGIEDDHIPFLQKGVPILHLIPTPFPPVWHTERDTVANLDFKTIDNLNQILRVFVSSYLNLNLTASGA